MVTKKQGHLASQGDAQITLVSLRKARMYSIASFVIIQSFYIIMTKPTNEKRDAKLMA